MNVVLVVSSDDTGESTASPATLTFTPANWSIAQTVTVTGVDDDPIDGPQGSTITLAVDDASSDDAYDGLGTGAGVTTTDDDVAGFTIAEVGGTTVNEAGSLDNFTVVLDAEPAPATVVEIDVTSQDTGEVTVSPATLTFTPANWSVVQTVTVTGIDDALDDGDRFTAVDVVVDNTATTDDDFSLSMNKNAFDSEWPCCFEVS